jgi:hypothetical protein
MGSATIRGGINTFQGSPNKIFKKYGIKIIEVITCPTVIAIPKSKILGSSFLIKIKIVAGIIPVKAEVKVK